MPATDVKLRMSDHVILLEARLGYPNPFVRPVDEITTEDEALAAVLEFAECYDLPFEELLRNWRGDPFFEKEPPQIRRIKEVLKNEPRKAT